MKDTDLPRGRYFISHSYRDVDERARLLEMLPKHIEPFVFPPITVTPTEFVSNFLIEAILACDGMIVLDGNYSAKSFWVAFERDYALRSNKIVFSFNPDSDKLTRLDQIQKPLDLPFYPHCADGVDRQQFNEILDFLRDERFLTDYWRDFKSNAPESIVRAGGYLILFRSKREHEYDARLKIRKLGTIFNDRTIIALLRNVPAPEWITRKLVINLFQNHNQEEIDHNRIDDVVVQLYWLIFQNVRNSGQMGL